MFDWDFGIGKANILNESEPVHKNNSQLILINLIFGLIISITYIINLLDQMIVKVLIASVLLVLVSSTFDYERSVSFNSDAQDVQYSMDMRYLLVQVDRVVGVRDYSTGKFMHNLVPEGKISTFAVGQVSASKTEQIVGVGLQSGEIVVFNVSSGSQIGRRQNTSDQIRSMCFSSDSSLVVMNNGQSGVRAFSWNDTSFDESVDLKGEAEQLKIQCHSQKSSFAVAWTPNNQSQLESDTPIVTFYKIQVELERIVLQNQIALDFEQHPNYIYDFKFQMPNEDDDSLFLVGNNQYVYQFNASSQQFNEFLSVQGSALFTKIEISDNADHIAVKNNIQSPEIVVFSQQDQIQSMGENYENYGWRSFKTSQSMPLFAMNKAGGELLYVKQSQVNTATVLQQCTSGQYYIFGKCQTCSGGCSTCIGNTECSNCMSTYFNQNNVCYRCLDRCQVCSNTQQCDKCLNPFSYIDNQCVCQNGYFIDGNDCVSCPSSCTHCKSSTHCTECQNSFQLKNDLCEQGPAFWIFVLVVGIPGCAIIAVIVINGIKARKKKERSLLEQEEVE